MPHLPGAYAFALPTDEALGAIAGVSPGGVVELGAGTGFWARLLADRGVDVAAFDVAPPPSAQNRWFAGVTPWYPVRPGDESVAEGHASRTLLLVWPTRNEDWAAAAVERYTSAGGQCVVFVGEGPGGSTGDDRLHALLGEYERCWSCAYGAHGGACVCGIRPRWLHRQVIELPRGHGGDLRIYRPDDSCPPLRPTPPQATRTRWWRRLIGRRLPRRAGQAGMA
jgi:hypothetical protein